MALTLTAGNIAGGVDTGTVSVSYPVPGGAILAGDLLYLFIFIHKATQASDEVPATPAGWAALIDAEGGVNTTSAVDVGLCRVYVFSTVAVGGETGSLNVTINNNTALTTSAGGAMWHVNASSGQVDVATAVGSDDVGGTALSVTFTSDPGITTDDLCLVGQATPTDTIPSGLTGCELSATGATFNTGVNENSQGGAGGLDLGIYRFAQTVASGPATAAPVWSGTIGGTTTNWAGPAALIRVRELVSINPEDGPTTNVIRSNIRNI